MGESLGIGGRGVNVAVAIEVVKSGIVDRAEFDDLGSKAEFLNQRGGVLRVVASGIIGGMKFAGENQPNGARM
jgi:hypothetical protein